MPKPKLDMTEFGATGLIRYSGIIDEEFLPALKQERSIRIYKEMRENDPIVGAMLFAIDMLIRGVRWYVEPAGDENEHLQAADFLESCMNDMSNTWEDTVSEILSMLTFGWSYHEIVYKIRLGQQDDPSKRSKYSDGKIGWRKIPIRSQDTLFSWEFDENGGLKGMVQQPPPRYNHVFIPIEKALLFRTSVQKGNPEGRSVLRSAFRPWYYKKQIEEIEGIGIERDLAGLPVAWVPPELLAKGASPDDKSILEEIKKIIRNVRRDEQEGVIFPLVYDEGGNKLYDFTLMTSNGRRQFDTDKIIQRYDQRIAMTVLADFILLGHEKVGSFALSSSKTELFSTAIGAWLDSIASVFNRYAIPRLFELNGMNTIDMPRIVHGDIETPNLTELADYISKLAGVGAEFFPDDQLENKLRSFANLPLKEEQSF